jgi:hypothetical protein
MVSQHCSTFRSLFVDLSEKIFRKEDAEKENEKNPKRDIKGKDANDNSPPFHPGEFGSHRELVSEIFLRPFTPDRYQITSGFILGENDYDAKDVDTDQESGLAQCDILVIEKDLAPFCMHRELGQFYPIEATSTIGEIKSQLTISTFKHTLNQISRQSKEFRVAFDSKAFPKKPQRNEIWLDESESTLESEDVFRFPLIFLICRRFALDEDSGTLPLWRKIFSAINADPSKRTIPDLILSLTDGLLIRTSFKQEDRYQCISPGKDSTTHLKAFLAIYFNHLVRWQSPRFRVHRYLQKSDRDMLFTQCELL